MKKLILVDPNRELCKAWQVAFQPYNEVEIVNNVFESVLDYDCMVSAANSFGLMDGGVDLAIINYFGKDLQSRVQQYIIREYNGEQPVGSSFLIETGDPSHPYLAHTPTMRVPMPIKGTDNVYLAMKAMLQAVKSFNAQTARVQTVLCPGLGTATGRVAVESAAAQMALAYEFYKNPPQKIDWETAANMARRVFAASC